MCGICGFNGPMNKKPNIDTLKILGILNEERGKDSAGIAFNNTILKKGNKTTFRELLEDEKINRNTVRGNVLIHTRAATVGGLTDDNAHPYQYDKDGFPSMIFMHNGTIRNIDELVKKYEVNVDGYLTDSRKLGQIIYNGHFDVLKEYTGAASIAFYYLDKPNEIYLWNGASQKTKDKWYYERGLYFTNLPNGVMYFSSQENHLKNALNGQDFIFNVPINTLCKFVDGQLVAKTKYDRSHMHFIDHGMPYSDDKPYTTAVHYGAVWKDKPSYYGGGGGYADWLFASYKHSLKIINDTYFTEFHKGSFFADKVTPGHVFFNGKGYVYSTKYKQLIQAHGEFRLNKFGYECLHPEQGSFKYFINGIMMPNKVVYEQCLEGLKGKTTPYSRTVYLVENSDMNTFYMDSDSGIIQSRYAKAKFNFEGFCTLPYSPFIFYIINDRVKGFIINQIYDSFFDTDAMIEVLPPSIKDLDRYIALPKSYLSLTENLELSNFDKKEVVVPDGKPDLFNNSWDNFNSQQEDDFDIQYLDVVEDVEEASEILFDAADILQGFKNAIETMELDLVDVKEALMKYSIKNGTDAFVTEIEHAFKDCETFADEIVDRLTVLN